MQIRDKIQKQMVKEKDQKKVKNSKNIEIR